MSDFIIDKQTLNDLNIVGKFKAQSLFKLFNKVNTAGGERLLEKWFLKPLNNWEEIDYRQRLLRFFFERKDCITVRSEDVSRVANYMERKIPTSSLAIYWELMSKKLLERLVKDEQYDYIVKGTKATVGLLAVVFDYVETLKGYPYPEQLLPFEKMNKIRTLLRNGSLDLEQEWTIGTLVKWNNLLLGVYHKEMVALLELIYLWDMGETVGKVARDNHFQFATMSKDQDTGICLKGFWHPAIKQAVGNDLRSTDEENMVFLTGANMAGKSTLMKAFGICMYLAHVGFPLPAKAMKCSVYDGILTSINLGDDINSGYSHFYAEVMRVKDVATQVSEGKRMVIIFDELFKGTNVKDAYDATLSITKAFSDYKRCFFVISTHIVEAGEALLSEKRKIQYKYMPTVMDNDVPIYLYKMTNGISNDRQGMQIIINEGIMDMLWRN